MAARRDELEETWAYGVRIGVHAENRFNLVLPQKVCSESAIDIAMNMPGTISDIEGWCIFAHLI